MSPSSGDAVARRGPIVSLDLRPKSAAYFRILEQNSKNLSKAQELKQQRRRGAHNSVIFKNNFTVFDINEKAHYFKLGLEHVENKLQQHLHQQQRPLSTASSFYYYTNTNNTNNAYVNGGGESFETEEKSNNDFYSMRLRKAPLPTQNKDIQIEFKVTTRTRNGGRENLEKKIQRWSCEIEFKHSLESRFRRNKTAIEVSNIAYLLHLLLLLPLLKNFLTPH